MHNKNLLVKIYFCILHQNFSHKIFVTKELLFYSLSILNCNFFTFSKD